jgi:uncharacterized protein (TIGR03066 family)
LLPEGRQRAHHRASQMDRQSDTRLTPAGRVFQAETHKVTGTWSLKGDQLTTVLTIGDDEDKHTVTIKELTDKKLVTVEKKGGETVTEFKK